VFACVGTTAFHEQIARHAVETTLKRHLHIPH
jgi:hypothetical protein